MRLPRALVHLVLALVLLATALAPARAVAFSPSIVSAHGSHGEQSASGVQVGPSGHEHGSGTERQPLHRADHCQTACCYMAAQPASPAPAATTVAFHCPVRYTEAMQPTFGEAEAPEPGIPKTVV
jgi:hypothetical protein